MKKFIVGKTYEGYGVYRKNTVTITKVTEKTVTFEHKMGKNSAKIRDCYVFSQSFRFQECVFQA